MKKNPPAKTLFDPAEMAHRTADAYSCDAFGPAAWRACCRLLARRGFNAEQAEAILRSKWMRWARDADSKYDGNSATLARYLDSRKITPESVELVKELGCQAPWNKDAETAAAAPALAPATRRLCEAVCDLAQSFAVAEFLPANSRDFCELVIDWAIEFEKRNAGVNWGVDREYIDEIDEWFHKAYQNWINTPLVETTPNRLGRPDPKGDALRRFTRWAHQQPTARKFTVADIQGLVTDADRALA